MVPVYPVDGNSIVAEHMVNEEYMTVGREVLEDLNLDLNLEDLRTKFLMDSGVLF